VHFERIADSSSIPIILYNVPTRTSVDLLPSTVSELCAHDNICGIKEALNEMHRIEALIKFQSSGFQVLSGDDPTAVQAIALGAKGLISVAANTHPKAMKHMVQLALDGQLGKARDCSQTLQPLFDALGIEPNPIPVKWALSKMGLCQPKMRLPLTELSIQNQACVQSALVVDGTDLANAA
jgi:4-hydroxy-tetrahydrodipicolinate synthase